MRFWRLVLILPLLGLTCGPARAEGSLTVHIVNDTPDNLMVTIYDRNLHRHQRVVSAQPINGNASIAITVSADNFGAGSLAWDASNTDRDFHQCGHGDKTGVRDGERIHVHADGKCRRK
jgi:hypothetical protein